MPVKLAINGFGRIGRAAFKCALEKKDAQVVAINDLMDTKTIAHLLRYDTVYGRYKKNVHADEKSITIDGKTYPVFSEKNPTLLPWAQKKVDVVMECTGIFTTRELASAHLKAGAKKVIISAPAKDDKTETIIFGTENSMKVIQKKASEDVISNASCTTNCISPVIQILESEFGVEKAVMTTIHSYTADQALVDGPHKDLRRARAAAQNIIPTSTGAARATTKVIPKLKNLFDGISIRVPTICVSLSDITCVLKKNTTEDEINQAFKNALKNPMFKNILDVTYEPVVSSDFIGSPYSAIVDASFTRVIGGNLAKVLAWYDNEWGYSMRLVELALSIAK